MWMCSDSRIAVEKKKVTGDPGKLERFVIAEKLRRRCKLGFIMSRIEALKAFVRFQD